MKIDPARKFFPKSFSDRDRAVFEAGIALGSLFHSVLGLPASADSKKMLENALEKSFGLQPFRRRVNVVLKGLRRKRGPYQYDSVTAEKLEATVVVVYGSATVKASVRYFPNIGYPLMYVSEVIERKSSSSPRPCSVIRTGGGRRSV
ncbi:MAG: dihydroneopterin aldolase family protein [Candidatus Caldarchaeum sp.]|nr:dihydroneopterin aldolase family protein [Candidatus Caldarchaeum sp.]